MNDIEQIALTYCCGGTPGATRCAIDNDTNSNRKISKIRRVRIALDLTDLTALKV